MCMGVYFLLWMTSYHSLMTEHSRMKFVFLEPLAIAFYIVEMSWLRNRFLTCLLRVNINLSLPHVTGALFFSKDIMQDINYRVIRKFGIGNTCLVFQFCACVAAGAR